MLLLPSHNAIRLIKLFQCTFYVSVLVFTRGEWREKKDDQPNCWEANEPLQTRKSTSESSVTLLQSNHLHSFLVPSEESISQVFTQAGGTGFLSGNQGKGMSYTKVTVMQNQDSSSRTGSRVRQRAGTCALVEKKKKAGNAVISLLHHG